MTMEPTDAKMEGRSRKARRRRSVAILALAALTGSAFCTWTLDPAADGASFHDRQSTTHLYASSTQRQLEADTFREHQSEFSICGRAIDTVESSIDATLREKYAACPIYGSETPMLVLEGYETFGRTANQLRSFLNAVQYSRDRNWQLGIIRHSWAMEVVLQFFLADGTGDGTGWEAAVEEVLCAKVINSPDELAGREVVRTNTVELFFYASSSSREEYAARMTQILRMLFRHYNTGASPENYTFQTKDNDALPVYAGDMCASIDSVFQDDPGAVVYSAVHLRYLEGNGKAILASVANATGCDDKEALAMRPEYVKSILAPLGMLGHPIVVITDGQRQKLIQALVADKDIGKMIRIVGPSASWIGGDISLATMANVFIGNPASTVSGFIAKSRVALGRGHNYLLMAKDATGEWKSVCDDDLCFFDPGKPVDDAVLQFRLSMTQDKRYGKPFRRVGEQWYTAKGPADKYNKMRKAYARKRRLKPEEWWHGRAKQITQR